MIVMLDNISVLAHDYENSYKELKPVLCRVVEKEVLLKIFKSWFGDTEVNFFSYETVYGQYQFKKKKKKECKAAIQKIKLPCKTKMFLLGLHLKLCRACGGAT